MTSWLVLRHNGMVTLVSSLMLRNQPRRRGSASPQGKDHSRH